MCTLMEHATEKRRISLKNTVVGFKSFHLCENFKCFEFFEIQVMSTVLVSQHTKNAYFGLRRLRIFLTSEQNRRQSSIGKSRSK